MLEGESLKLWAAQALPASVAAPGEAPGSVLAVGAEGIDVATGDGVLRLTQLQRAGGKRLAAADFLRGFDVKAGQVFGQPEA